MSVFEKYRKNHPFLVCIDSDGCAMDTMDIKHFQCFGPCMVREWGLEKWEDVLLEKWNEVNLYTMTRGINRFLALAKTLEEADEKYCRIEGMKELAEWTRTAKALSNQTVKEAWEQTGNPVFQKALAWSEAVNQSITRLPKASKKPFPGVKEGVFLAHDQADVAIVSSANADAVLEEWDMHGLMEAVDICLTQNEGSKAFCIARMLDMGYEKDHVLMVGDAPGDKAAAESNGGLYYPILVKHEEESWRRFASEALPKFLDGTYEGEYQQNRIREFEENLKG